MAAIKCFLARLAMPCPFTRYSAHQITWPYSDKSLGVLVYRHFVPSQCIFLTVRARKLELHWQLCMTWIRCLDALPFEQPTSEHERCFFHASRWPGGHWAARSHKTFPLLFASIQCVDRNAIAELALWNLNCLHRFLIFITINNQPTPRECHAICECWSFQVPRMHAHTQTWIEYIHFGCATAWDGMCECVVPLFASSAIAGVTCIANARESRHLNLQTYTLDEDLYYTILMCTRFMRKSLVHSTGHTDWLFTNRHPIALLMSIPSASKWLKRHARRGRRGGEVHQRLIICK